MSNFIALVKVEMKNYVSQTNANLGVGSKKILIFFLLGILAFSFFTMGYQMSRSLYIGFEQINQTELTFTVMYVLASMVILFLSLTALIHLFYYSKNTGFLLTMPIKENTIIFSRLAVQYIYSFIMSALFLVPSIYVVLSNDGVTVVKLFGAVIILLLTPMIPLILATILIVIIMSFANKFISRRAMSIITNVVLLALIIGVQLIVVRQTESSEFILDLLLTESGLLYYFGLQFPPVVLATQAIVGKLLSLVIFVLVNIVLIAIAGFVIGPAVKKSLRDYQQGEGKVKSKAAKYVESSQTKVLVKRNLLIIFKNPAFLMNMLVLILLPFIMIGINMVSGQFSLEQMKLMFSELANPEYAGLLTLIVAGVLIMPSFMGTFSATAITREGRFLWQVKSAPIDARVDLKARLLSCFIMSIISVVIVVPLAVYLLPMSLVDLLFALVIALLGIITMLQIDILIDIERPILDWTSPTQAIKNNLNILLALAWRILVALLIFLVFRFLPIINLSGSRYVILIIFIALSIISHKLYNRGVKKYQDLEI